MTEKVRQHYPTPAVERTIDGVDNQRIYDQRIMQDNITRSLDELAEKTQLDSFILTDIDLDTGTTNVEHKLGYAWSGWYIVDINANATVYRDPDSTADTTKFIPLIATAECTVKMVVF